MGKTHKSSYQLRQNLLSLDLEPTHPLLVELVMRSLVYQDIQKELPIWTTLSL